MQYPGVAEAVRADLQNLGMIMRLLKRMAPGLDVKAIAQEIKERIVEELDYELEAQNQRSLARIFGGHPFIVVPDVVSSLSREQRARRRVRAGVGFEELKELDQAERDRVGEIVFRFFFGCLYRHRQFSGDPHPGNFLLQDDGRVAFLDFGLFKRDARDAVELELAASGPALEGDGEALQADLDARPASSRDPEHFGPEKLLASSSTRRWWYVLDEEIELSPEIATQVMIEMSDPRSRTSARCATRRCPPTTCSAGAWRCSRSRSSRSCAPAPTGTGSPASGSTATRR